MPKESKPRFTPRHKKRKQEEVFTEEEQKELNTTQRAQLSTHKRRRYAANAAYGELKFKGDESLAEAMEHALKARGEFNHATQRFHTYPARLHPKAAQLLIDALPGQRLLDPFCGGGTILVEGMRAGREVFGFDINPVAQTIARARTMLLSEAERQVLGEAFEKVGERAKQIDEKSKNPAIPAPVWNQRSWYNKKALRELAALWSAVNQKKGLHRHILRAAHSSLVVKYSLRASDTSNKVRPRKYKEGAVLRAFAARGVELDRMFRELREQVPVETPRATIGHGDAREIELAPVDLIVTSPPYPGTYDYLRLQQLRLAWWEEDQSQESSEIGTRQTFSRAPKQAYRRWSKDTALWIKRAARNLKIGGHLVIVAGDGFARGRVQRVSRPTLEAGEAAGLSLRASASVQRVDHGVDRTKLECIFVFHKDHE